MKNKLRSFTILITSRGQLTSWLLRHPERQWQPLSTRRCSPWSTSERLAQRRDYRLQKVIDKLSLTVSYEYEITKSYLIFVNLPGISKNPWICEAWRSMVMMWSVPATVNMLATNLALMGALQIEKTKTKFKLLDYILVQRHLNTKWFGLTCVCLSFHY